MNNRTKYGMPGLTGAFVLAAGVIGFWCRDAGVFAMILMLLIFAAAGTAAFIVSEG